MDVSRVIFDDENKTGILFKERFQHANLNVYYYRNDLGWLAVVADN